jgi:hypothetical protein
MRIGVGVTRRRNKESRDKGRERVRGKLKKMWFLRSEFVHLEILAGSD